MARRSVALRSEVPYLHEKQIEREADVLLQEFSLKFYAVTVPPVPVDDITELHLQLALEYKDMKALFPFADVHGAIWFERKTVGVDQSLDPKTNPSRLGRYHFTLAHEVGHWRLHREHYKKNPAERRLFDDRTATPDVVCRSSEAKKPVEWQADKFASCLLMPRKLVYAAWSSRLGTDASISIGELRRRYADTLATEPFFYRGQVLTEEEDKDNALKEEQCRPLADLFQVSQEAMRIRLETLKLYVKTKEASLF